MEIYKSSSAEWPLLQSKTEQKFKSGLFNVSAEFIRPVGNTALPETIETSIGPVDVWPEPTVSSGTDGFERINATGYGAWTAVPQIEYGVGPAILHFFADIETNRYYGDPQACERSYGRYSYSLPGSSEYCVITQIYNANAAIVYPSLPRELNVWDASGNIITSSTFNFSNPFPPLNPSAYSFNPTQEASLVKQIGREMSMERLGNLKIVTFSFVPKVTAFYFSFIEPYPPECISWK